MLVAGLGWSRELFRRACLLPKPQVGFLGRGCHTGKGKEGVPGGPRRGSSSLGRWWVPLPAGLAVLGVLQWRRLERRRSGGVAHHWEITCYRCVPLRSLSRVFGWVSETTLPGALRPIVYSWYARLFGVNLDEACSSDLSSYNCLAEFFARALKAGLRPIDEDHSLVSPVDGTLVTGGRLESFKVEQVKGVTYSLRTFLGDQVPQTSSIQHHGGGGGGHDLNHNRIDYLKSELSWSEYKGKLVHNPENELYQVVLYLAPGDYHRFHAPASVNIKHRRHFQGELLSVNPRMLSWIPDLFSLNERAVYLGSWEHGFFSMTAVGATNVGSIRVYKDQTLHTNALNWKEGRRRDADLEVSWSKGEEVGEFRMGSTIVLIFEAPPNFRLAAGPGHRTRVGSPLTNTH